MDKLTSRLAGLPLVIAGPILRRVTDAAVTVWIVLQKPATVKLQVSSGNPTASVNVGVAVTQPTIAIGRSIHIVAITAQVSLVPGIVYTYDMIFTVFDSAGRATGDVPLLMAIIPTTTLNPISYPPFTLPSFSLPTQDLNDLRIIHGSCRMPHGDGADALSILDDLIRVTVQNAAKRPHQLLLTGDQIYADDVAAALLLQLMDASNTLLGTDTVAPGGWRLEETLPAGLPVGGSTYHTHKPSDFPPLTREDLLGTSGAGFTSADLRSHLMSFGEYLCMYLFTWSDVLWPAAAALPSQSEITGPAKAAMDIGNWDPRDDDKRLRFANDASAIKGDTRDVQTYLQTLSKVRRALANVPVYMIFDDHDVTDDWNMTPEFCDRVYDHDNGLGRRIVQNALVAYALCQLWGNTPEQFQVDASSTPAAGRRLLSFLHNKTAIDYDLNSEELQNIVGLHDAGKMKARKPEASYHDQSAWLTIGGVQVSGDSLVYNFTYTGPSHQIVVTDTRSWRSYPNGNDATADLLPPDQIIAQIPLTPDLGDRALMVVLTTNAPPVQPIRGATRHNTLTTVISRLFKSDAHPDLFESWEIPSLSFDHLLKRITDKFKSDASGVRYGQALLLSGDVHHSFASRLVYNATNRYGDTTPQKAHAVVAQLVASSYKKQNDDTIGFQREGYFYVPNYLANGIINKVMTEGYVGWNVPAGGTPYSVGNVAFSVYKKKIRKITNIDPTIQIFPVQDGDFVDLDLAPDYRYRLDYLLPEAQFSQSATAPPIPALLGSGATPDQRKAAMETFNAATGHYREHNRNPYKQKVIGRNNISEVTFDWGAKDSQGDHKKVNHTVRWRTNSANFDNATPDPIFPDTYVMWTNYSVNLDPNDKAFPDLVARKEGP